MDRIGGRVSIQSRTVCAGAIRELFCVPVLVLGSGDGYLRDCFESFYIFVGVGRTSYHCKRDLTL